jgi:moderate conductance mechanosensitive channel
MLNTETLKIALILLAAFGLCAAVYWLIGALQRRLVRKFIPAESREAGAPPLLRRLYFDWACNALRTLVWCLFFALLLNVLPQTRSEVVSLDVWLRRIGELVPHALNRGIPLVILVIVIVFVMRFASALLKAVFTLLEHGAASRQQVAARRRLQTLSAISRGVAQVVIGFIGLMVLLRKLGVEVTPILASAGVVGIAIGFGAQSLIKDLFSGFLILLEDQFSVGDAVKIGEVAGAVEQLTLRVTRIRALDGSLTTIPNGTITMVSNFSKDWSRAVLDVDIDSTEDSDRAAEVMLQTTEEYRKEKPLLIIEEASMQGIDRLSAGAITLRLTAKTAPNKQADVLRELRRRVKLAFAREGIKTPSSHQQLVLLNQTEKGSQISDLRSQI